MRTLENGFIIPSLFFLTLFVVVPGVVLADDEHEDKAHQHPEAQKLENPVALSTTSVNKGKELFEKYCVECHGPNAKGNGDMVEFLSSQPADLTDEKWIHGSTDGEIFTVIRDGTKKDMESFGDRLSEEEMWHLVNYLKTISGLVE